MRRYTRATKIFTSVSLHIHEKKNGISPLMCIIGEETDAEVDGANWSSKPIEDWCQEETINWLMMAASCLGQNYSSIQQNLALPGKELLSLSRHDFVARDPVFGERLYNLLHTQAVSSQCKSAASAANGLHYFAPRHNATTNNMVDRSHGEQDYGNRTHQPDNYQNLCNSSGEDENRALGSNNVSGELNFAALFRYYEC